MFKLNYCFCHLYRKDAKHCLQLYICLVEMSLFVLYCCIFLRLLVEQNKHFENVMQF